MNKKLLSSFLYILMTFFLISCGTSTGSRYEKSTEKTKEETESEIKETVENEENFDLTTYHAEINVTEPIELTPNDNPDIWYEYSDDDSISEIIKSVKNKRDGYRVQVYSTDNLDEANNIRSELYFKTNQKNVYVIFDPPFYKIKVGDYLTQSEANQMNFKLNQMGYTESRVVKDSVNVYQ